MSPTVIAIILAATLITAAISGVFGMAGGLILMGALTSVAPVATAMVLHGSIQIVSNFSRAAFLWKHISWAIVGRYCLGIVGAVVLIASIAWRPTGPTVFIMLGLTAMVVWIPKSWVEVNVERKWQAELCGFMVQTVNTLAGVAGPLLDIFFVKTLLPRQTVVATKATTQVLAHAVKIAFWGFPLVAMLNDPARASEAHFPPLWVLGACVPLSLIGTWLGGLVLDRMTDVGFRQWTKWIVTATGTVYLLRGFFPGLIQFG
ncbi:MAG TPA: TSUP family transporter [Hyphomonadaceae bacterium]|nr:TSUP family transporter [Hyphomonadaceae bacterium]